MKILGIISEYNPFHSGHLYHLRTAQKSEGFDGVVSVMSGNFVQRGEPAIFDKWARAEMALSQGIDLVLELPAMYATRSAYWFARGGVETLSRTGVVTHLAFGIEDSSPESLYLTADLLANETPEFQQAIKIALKEGCSFPRARSQALAKLLPSSRTTDSPNNVLGLAYLQVIRESNLPLIPLPIQRKGSGYNDSSCSVNALPSATAVRKILSGISSGEEQQISGLVPQEVLKIIAREINQGKGPILPEYLDSQFMTLLRKNTLCQLSKIVDVSEGLENRILQKAQTATDFRNFLDKLKTKRFTYSRLQRFLVHLLLDYTKEKDDCLSNGPPYIRVLGFSSNGRGILKEIKNLTTLPLITKTAHSNTLLKTHPHFRHFMEMDTLATDLYALLYPNKSARIGHQDYYRKPVII